ncbi:MAG: DUF5681 domain-containing protein [Croceibacterium sp.]
MTTQTETDKVGDYEIGYAKPPAHSRFQPGQSGNPRGRKKGSRGLKADLNAELASMLTIQINGKPVRGTRQQLMLKAIATRAATGDVRAAALLLPLILQVFGIEDRGGEHVQLSPRDKALLDLWLTGDDKPDSAEPAHG